MDKRTKSSSTNDERGQTDTSLVSERGKTDDSFAGHRRQTELETDRRVQHDRQGADIARAQSRESTDATTDLGRAGRSKFQKNRTNDEMTADNTLHDQRVRDDAAVTSERSLMDAALVSERAHNDVESARFLQRERKEADRNLLRERTRTDSEALLSSNLLTSELSSHKATKLALTSRDEFLAIVSHDLRNPIGAILSYADLLLEEFPRTNNEARSWAEVIKRNAETSLRLISDILDMERFAEGKLNMKFAARDIDALIRETIESFLHIAAEKKITLHMTPSENHRLVSCDRDRIGQVLANLIGNALKFTPANGTITVESSQTANEAKVSVTDTGAGIPNEQKKRIFDRYTQLGNKDRQGLGLGLYISNMLVDAHQGKISVISAKGKGSVFSFIIPIKRSAIAIGGL
jgi:signal transduction histidine kinase